MEEFIYQDVFPSEKDNTEYKHLTKDFVSVSLFENKKILKIEEQGLVLLAEQAFKDVSHYLRSSHLKVLAKIIDSPDASANDKYVAMELLKNAIISAQGTLPMCQDTGTAIIMAKKGQRVWTDYNDSKALSHGVYNAYVNNNLRYSQNIPLSMFEEKNTGSNLPAQIDISACEGDEYKFLFIAKGGGSANKTYLYQETKTLLNDDSLVSFMEKKMISIGTSGCPPYHLVFVIGGLSAEFTLKTVKLATAGYLDYLPLQADGSGQAFRDVELENRMLKISREIGIGAQFGGQYFCHDVRIIRLPRHGASCPVGMGVSCSADRNIKAKINSDGIFLEALEANPLKYLPEEFSSKPLNVKKGTVSVNLDRPMQEILDELSKYPVSTRLLLTGKMIVARDIVHSKLYEEFCKKKDLPQYFKDYIVYYAGPAKTPDGYASGSFGPTTAGRMDSYVPVFQEYKGSMITLAKGNRSEKVRISCKKNKGFYLGCIGGNAAKLGKECIKKVETIAYHELGMEAVFMISVENFPAFILIDDKGNDFFEPYSISID